MDEEFDRQVDILAYCNFLVQRFFVREGKLGLELKRLFFFKASLLFLTLKALNILSVTDPRIYGIPPISRLILQVLT